MKNSNDRTVIRRSVESSSANRRLGNVPQVFLNAGFVFALVLAGVCLLFSALYLYAFLRGASAGIDPIVQGLQTNASSGSLEVLINGRLVMARLSLLSCGIFVGISFGFLGFALCLLGVKEAIDVDFESDSYKARFARMSPGVLIIICSSILTGFCATRQTPFWYERILDASGSGKQERKDPTNNSNDSRLNDQDDQGGDRNVPARSKEFSRPTP